MSTDKLVELLTKAIAFKYPKDATRPGLTISLLNTGNYYVSVVRHNIDGKVKVVVFKALSSSLENALKQVAQQLVADIEPKNPLEVLAQNITEAKAAVLEDSALAKDNSTVNRVPRHYDDEYVSHHDRFDGDDEYVSPLAAAWSKCNF